VLAANRSSVMVALLLALTGCSSGGVTPDAQVNEPITTQPIEPLPLGPLTAVQISNALKERTFSYTAGPRRGKVTYYADGTFTYDEVGKGSGTGIWQASDGKLCEARDPTAFLPKGTPSTCSPFSANGTIYIAGTMRLIAA
jgi:hypothetical protein